ncbi:MAG: peptide chain release factor N(5)-glutamine methyltransferase, partial [Bradymonadaceae bacterium]
MAREKKLGPGELGPPWTVLKLLRWTTGYFEDNDVTSTPRLDADLLLGHVLGLDRVQLYARTDEEVGEQHRKAFRQLVKRRTNGEPVAYLIGRKEFWQLELKVDERALVPRPETEVAVEVALDRLPEPNGEFRVADIGTGSGAIALALTVERDDLAIAATDTSGEALALARENAETHDLSDRIDFFQGDLLDALPEQWRPLDVIVSNPPYVPQGDREEVTIEVRDHEPGEALYAGPAGLEITKRLVPAAHEWLAEGGWLIFEIGFHQNEAVRELLAETGFTDIAIRQDYEGHDRVASGRK